MCKSEGSLPTKLNYVVRKMLHLKTALVINTIHDLELSNDSVFLVGIGWYFLGIYQTNTKGKLGRYILISKIWREPPFSLKREAFAPFKQDSAPLMKIKRVPAKS